MQPASGDAGGALGAALAAYYQHLGQPSAVFGDGDAMQGSYLGSAFEDHKIEQRLRDAGAIFDVLPF